jgi:hypothetical protein
MFTIIGSRNFAIRVRSYSHLATYYYNKIIIIIIIIIII